MGSVVITLTSGAGLGSGAGAGAGCAPAPAAIAVSRTKTAPIEFAADISPPVAAGPTRFRTSSNNRIGRFETRLARRPHALEIGNPAEAPVLEVSRCQPLHLDEDVP